MLLTQINNMHWGTYNPLIVSAEEDLAFLED